MQLGNIQVNTQNVENLSGKNAQVNSAQTKNIQSATLKGSGELPQTMSSLSPGDVFEGTVTRDESGRLTIHLANGESVFARVDGSVNLLENTATFFQVKRNQSGQLVLKTVSQDPSANPTLVKALEQAGVMVDSDNLALVQEMMKQQMPIDAKSLATMVRIAYANRGVDPTTLIQLTKLGLPVIQENIQQFQQYMAGEGNVVKSMNNIMSQLPTALEHAITSGLDGKSILSQLNEIFNGVQVTATTGNGGETGVAPENINAQNNYNVPELTEGTVINRGDGTGSQQLHVNIEGQAVAQEQVQVMEQGQESALLQNGDQLQQDGQPQNVGKLQGEGLLQEMMQSVVEGKNSGGMQQVTPEALLSEGVNGQPNETTPRVQQSPVEQLLEQLGQRLASGETTPKELFNLLNKQIEGMNLTKEDFQALFQNKTFKNLLTAMMEQEWLLTPEEFKGENKLSEVYEKVQHQMNRLEQMLSQLGKSEQSIVQDMKDIRGNVQFMNDLSQFYNYVQVPLKMFAQNARGDLYVYTDKRALRQGKEELTAHLHLELEHLGTTDVYVHLREKKISTNFIMEREESLDLVLENIDILTKRLQDKGYDVATKVELRNEETKEPDFMQEVLGRELPTVAIQRYSMDVCV